MSKIKIAISLDGELVKEIDRLVKRKFFPNRSNAIQDAVQDKIKKIEHQRLADECAKLNPDFEKALAEEGGAEDLNEWPEY
jgi:metal-responsive CopG/Arc/MetJ family transcriptional regulator